MDMEPRTPAGLPAAIEAPGTHTIVPRPEHAPRPELDPARRGARRPGPALAARAGAAGTQLAQQRLGLRLRERHGTAIPELRVEQEATPAEAAAPAVVDGVAHAAGVVDATRLAAVRLYALHGLQEALIATGGPAVLLGGKQSALQQTYPVGGRNTLALAAIAAAAPAVLPRRAGEPLLQRLPEPGPDAEAPGSRRRLSAPLGEGDGHKVRGDLHPGAAAEGGVEPHHVVLDAALAVDAIAPERRPGQAPGTDLRGHPLKGAA
mmetsp:Transcript_37105/g.110771  ORF Transcript_37105/g.110771 Transcript_37105/m.110771 type:complete len:263 (+) Transcript_37105:784-1572(+)